MKIIVFPSFFKPIYDNEYQRKEVKEFLTIEVPGAKYTPLYKMKRWDGKKCFYDRFKESVPIGFLDRFVRRFNIKQSDIQDTREYLPIKFKMPTLNGLELRPYQREAIFSGFDYKNCLIQAATNAGKSAIIAGLIKVLKEEKVLIFIHRKEILWQLRQMIMDQTGMNVGFITSEATEIDPHVNIGMVMTILNRLGDDDSVTEVYERSKVVMVDEAHHGQAATFQSALRRSPAVYRFGFSGTIQPDDTYDGWQTRMYIGDVIFNIGNKELIEQGISAKPKIIIFRLEHHINYKAMVEDVKREHIEKGIISADEELTWMQNRDLYKPLFSRVLKRYVVENDERNAIIVRETCGRYKDQQCLIVVDYLDHGQRIYDMLWEREKMNVAYIHGASETRQGSLDAFKAGQLRVLISSNIIDEGVDISRIQMLFLAGGKKSRRQILQRIGRGLRRKEVDNTVHILDFYDADGKYLEKHSRERLKIYRREDFEIEIV